MSHTFTYKLRIFYVLSSIYPPKMCLYSDISDYNISYSTKIFTVIIFF